MKKLLFLAAVALFTALCGTAQAAEGTLSVKHRLGTVEIPRKPARVVVMDFGSLDTIDALGVKAALALPKGNLPAYLGKYKAEEYSDLGGLKEFNLETVNSFKPDLIIISGRQQDYYEELSSIAPVLLVEIPLSDYLGNVSANILTLGDIFDMRENAEKQLAVILKKIGEANAKVLGHNQKAMVLLTNDGKISVFGSGSRFGMVHDVIGFAQADTAIKIGRHGQLVNYEYIAEKNPDIIFVVDRTAAVGGKADGMRILQNELVGGTNAAKNNRIIALDPDVWYLSGGGLESLGLMVNALAAAADK